ncbi:helix-turn-helix domain-containing protein [Nocardia harenae]|uniref:helix-turn-helix domain-containing protein n=1 Tax=Nocardia harenae TaxID=358707 RepID=UPI000835CA8A|nr:XRE family transcriptional regulator [Nocardia harenae]
MTQHDENTTQEYTSVFDALADTPAEADNLRVRSHLMSAISDRIDEFDWSQRVAADNLGVTQPRISDLKNGKLSRFSIDTLVNLAKKVGLHVKVELVPADGPSGSVEVSSRADIAAPVARPEHVCR